MTDSTLNDVAQPTSTQSDLDSVINEYEQAQPAPTPVDPSIIEYVKSEMNGKFETELTQVSERVKGDLNVTPQMARDYIDGEASRNPAIQKAFTERKTNPQGWDSAVETLKTSFSSQFIQVDEKTTTDTNDMIAAVQGSSSETDTPDAPIDYAALSDEDFQKQISGIR